MSRARRAAPFPAPTLCPALPFPGSLLPHGPAVLWPFGQVFRPDSDGSSRAQRLCKLLIRSGLLWAVLVAVRLCASALTARTAFVPDEYWQAREPAHALAFGGHGYATWEWGPDARLRGWLYPVVLSLPLHVARWLGLAAMDAHILAWLPAALQAVLTATAEAQFIARLANLADPVTACVTGVFLTAQWFQMYCAGRTLVNTVEACLLLLAFASWPYAVAGRPGIPPEPASTSRPGDWSHRWPGVLWPSRLAQPP